MNDSGLMATLPADSDTHLPPNPLLEEHALHGGQSVVQVANHTSFNAVKLIDWIQWIALVVETISAAHFGSHRRYLVSKISLAIQ